MPSAVIALGVIGVSGAAAEDGPARGSRTGTILRYRMDTAQVRTRWLRSVQVGVRRILLDEYIASTGVKIAEDRVLVTLRDPGKMEQAARLLATLALPVSGQRSQTAYNLKVKGRDDGAIWVESTPEGLSKQVEGALHRSVEIVRQRVDPEGGEIAAVTAEGQDGIAVQFAGLDASEAKARIGMPGRLTFQLVDDTMSPEEAQANGVPPDDQLLPDTEHPGHSVLVNKAVWVANDGIVSARVASSIGGAGPSVDFEFNARGADALAEMTRENAGKRFAVVLDGTVLAAPRILNEIPGGHGQVTGNFRPEEATRLALVLRSGALPVPLSLVEERTIELTARRRE